MSCENRLQLIYSYLIFAKYFIVAYIPTYMENKNDYLV